MNCIGISVWAIHEISKLEITEILIKKMDEQIILYDEIFKIKEEWAKAL